MDGNVIFWKYRVKSVAVFVAENFKKCYGTVFHLVAD